MLEDIINMLSSFLFKNMMLSTNYQLSVYDLICPLYELHMIYIS
jgi:hypothetical protein